MEERRPRISEDIPSYKDLVKDSSKPKEFKIPKGIRVEKGKKRLWGRYIVAFIIAILMIGIGIAFLEHYEFYKSWNFEFTVYPKSTYPLGWKLSKDSILEINATVKGGNGDIIVYVVDRKTGIRVQDYGKLVSPISIRFKAPKSGDYDVYFDNTFSTLMPKKISAVAAIYTKEESTWAVELIFMGIILLILVPIFAIIGIPYLRVYIDEDVFEFTPKGKFIPYLEIKVNGIPLNEKVKDSIKFRVGQNEDRVLEIEKKFSIIWTARWIIKIDGQEVGRLP